MAAELVPDCLSRPCDDPQPMTPQEFIRKWTASTLGERQASQEHFIDLCRLLGQKTPAEADPDGTWYCFEKGAAKYGGGDGWADVWRKGHFAWEYKGKHKDLVAAYDQLLRYRESLDSPPLLVVCDMQRFEIHTNFTGTAKQVHAFDLSGLAEEANRKILEALFVDPERLKPGVRIEEVTEEAARQFASLAQSMRGRGIDPQRTAHFLNRLLFCLFAEDVGLLPGRLFQKLVDAGSQRPDDLTAMLGDLFKAMAVGGRFGLESIQHFNGGLFTDHDVIAMTASEVAILRQVATLNWGQIEPAIFGTLFERGLDPSKRSQLGAHYTDRGSILRIVEPVLMAPLRREWAVTRERVESLLDKAKSATTSATEQKHRREGAKAIQTFRKEHLDPIQVLDPACGSGNFLYIALELLHELEKEVLLVLAEVYRGQSSLDIRVGPHMVHGIEINVFAHELAQVTIWIGHLQWHLKNGFDFTRDPVLHPIESVECRDAIVDLRNPAKPKEAVWPKADVVIGNPPFLGGKRLRTVLGDEYVEAMFAVYDGKVPREADLVTYWFEKARAAIEGGKLRRAGLLATNSIRGGASRKVLDQIRETGQIFMAWSDEAWIVEGAAVRISLIGFDSGAEKELRLDGQPVVVINPDLTGGATAVASLDLTRARRLKENLGIAFMGDTKGGPFDIPRDLARRWIALPLNPSGRPNSDVVRPWVNGLDVTRRPRDMWIIDFGVEMSERDAALYEAPFQHVVENVKPDRLTSRRESYRNKWWIHMEPRPAMRRALAGLERFLVTPALAKHRMFEWMPIAVLPDHQLFAFARDDDFVFGVLQSRLHAVWSLRKGTSLEDRPRYTATTTFETFPLPHPKDVQGRAIGAAAAELDRLRQAWLNPKGTVASESSKRTMTVLYNQRPTWLAAAHDELDAAVAAAYGWPADIPEEEVLRRLLALNQEREPA